MGIVCINLVFQWGVPRPVAVPAQPGGSWNAEDISVWARGQTPKVSHPIASHNPSHPIASYRIVLWGKRKDPFWPFCVHNYRKIFAAKNATVGKWQMAELNRLLGNHRLEIWLHINKRISRLVRVTIIVVRINTLFLHSTLFSTAYRFA